MCSQSKKKRPFGFLETAFLLLCFLLLLPIRFLPPSTIATTRLHSRHTPLTHSRTLPPPPCLLQQHVPTLKPSSQTACPHILKPASFPRYALSPVQWHTPSTKPFPSPQPFARPLLPMACPLSRISSVCMIHRRRSLVLFGAGCCITTFPPAASIPGQ